MILDYNTSELYNVLEPHILQTSVIVLMGTIKNHALFKISGISIS
jgi:hypothetical protein